MYGRNSVAVQWLGLGAFTAMARVPSRKPRRGKTNKQTNKTQNTYGQFTKENQMVNKCN